MLTTNNLESCLRFYSDVLGMDVVHTNDRYALHFGKQKINTCFYHFHVAVGIVMRKGRKAGSGANARRAAKVEKGKTVDATGRTWPSSLLE